MAFCYGTILVSDYRSWANLGSATLAGLEEKIIWCEDLSRTNELQLRVGGEQFLVTGFKCRLYV